MPVRLSARSVAVRYIIPSVARFTRTGARVVA
jgi:hypothetical protein